MANITGRVAKKAVDLLEPGEQVVAALLLEPKGSYGVGSAALAALPRVTAKLLEGRAATRQLHGGGMAAAFPSSSFVLAATDRRVVAIPSNGIKMSAIGTSVALGELEVVANDGKGLGRRLTIAFADGTSLVADAQRGQPFDEFARAARTV